MKTQEGKQMHEKATMVIIRPWTARTQGSLAVTNAIRSSWISKSLSVSCRRYRPCALGRASVKEFLTNISKKIQRSLQSWTADKGLPSNFWVG